MNNSERAEYLKNKELQMMKCNNLFVKLKEGYWVSGFHSLDYEYEPDIFKCVHCGLTNKYNEDCSVLKRHHIPIPINYLCNKEISKNMTK